MEGNLYQRWVADLYFLQQAELALATHPRVECPYPVEPAICRLLLATCVGVIDAILEDNRDQEFLRNYFSLSKRPSTKEKATALFSGLLQAGVVVDINVVRDYECLKYLRNQVIHTRASKDTEALLLGERQWPGRPDDFTMEHADRIVGVFRAFVSYFIKARFVDSFETGDERIIEIGDLHLVPGPAKALERLRALPSPRNALSSWWSSAEKALDLAMRSGPENTDLILALRDLALDVWQHRRDMLAQAGLTPEVVIEHRRILEELIDHVPNVVLPLCVRPREVVKLESKFIEKLREKGCEDSVRAVATVQREAENAIGNQLDEPLWGNVTEPMATALSRFFFNLETEDHARAVARALRGGFAAYNLVRNSAMTDLLARLVVLLSSNQSQMGTAEAGRESLDALRLRVAWYHILENIGFVGFPVGWQRNSRQPIAGPWESYEKVFDVVASSGAA